jgi:hypothetical protein
VETIRACTITVLGFPPLSGFVRFVRFVVPHLPWFTSGEHYHEPASSDSTTNHSNRTNSRFVETTFVLLVGPERPEVETIRACAITVLSFPPLSGFVRFVRFVVPHLPWFTSGEHYHEPASSDSTTNHSNRTNGWFVGTTFGLRVGPGRPEVETIRACTITVLGFPPLSGFVRFVRFVVPHLPWFTSGEHYHEPASSDSTTNHSNRTKGWFVGTTFVRLVRPERPEVETIRACTITVLGFPPLSGFVEFVRFVVPTFRGSPQTNTTTSQPAAIRPRITRIERMVGSWGLHSAYASGQGGLKWRLSERAQLPSSASPLYPVSWNSCDSWSPAPSTKKGEWVNPLASFSDVRSAGPESGR